MSEQGGQDFVIRDRRGRGGEPAEETRGDTPSSGPEPHSTATGASTDAPRAPDQGPPISFSSFVFSLGTSALMVMGEKIDPHQPEMPVNPVQAKEIIDILSILEEKTRGNLGEDEQIVLRDMLYALRMKYVDLVSGKPATPSS